MKKAFATAVLGAVLVFALVRGCVSMTSQSITPEEQTRIDETWKCRQDPTYKTDEECGKLYQPRDTESYLRRWKR